MKRSLATAAGLGMVSGLRAFHALAWVSRELSHGRSSRHAPGLERWLSSGIVAAGLATAASGEFALDKMPFLGDRIRPSSLLGRVLFGAAVGAVAAGRERQLMGAAVGAGSAVVGAYAGWFLRREAGRVTFLPDPVIGMAEDALAAALSSRLVGAQ